MWKIAFFSLKSVLALFGFTANITLVHDSFLFSSDYPELSVFLYYSLSLAISRPSGINFPCILGYQSSEINKELLFFIIFVKAEPDLGTDKSGNGQGAREGLLQRIPKTLLLSTIAKLNVAMEKRRCMGIWGSSRRNFHHWSSGWTLGILAERGIRYHNVINWVTELMQAKNKLQISKR